MKYLCPRDFRRGEMEEKMKNIAQSEVLTLREQISYQEGQIVSKTLTQNLNICCTKENLLSCQQAIPMRYMGRKRSRCF